MVSGLDGSEDRHPDGLWARTGNLLLSGWLVVSAFAWDGRGSARVDAVVVGYLVFVFSVVATVVDEVRALNSLLAMWMIASAWLFPSVWAVMRWNTALVGVAMLALSLVSSRGGGVRLPRLRALLRDLDPSNAHAR